MIAKIRKLSAIIVSLGIPHTMPLGTIIGSLVALPLIEFWRLASIYIPNIMMWCALVFFAIIALSSLLVISLPIEEQPPFVADKVAGLIFVFMGIPLTIKLMIIGIVLFHALRSLLPYNKYDRYLKFLKLIGAENNIFYSIISGLAINMLLHFALWIAQ
ncbi:MAG: hypothetical protein WC365_02730 [Candidatus Babeliales bacterium]|jgi:phosphatidylglycerophosphatase A